MSMKSAGTPRSITKLKIEASCARRSLIKSYRGANQQPTTHTNEYLNEPDIITSHILRSEAELNDPGGTQAPCPASSMLADYQLTGGGNTLCEVSVGAIAMALKTRANLSVAAGFFASAIGCIDDYLDREGDYDRYGKGLYWASHAYRDLQDRAIDLELSSGRLSAEELREIKLRLHEVILTLVKSESTSEPEDYLYRKSCGDKVIAVLFPVTDADESVKLKCAEIGRLTAEAGQLIDDAMDYELDRERKNKNYMLMRGGSIHDGLGEAELRLRSAKEASATLGPGPIPWLLDTMEGVVDIFRARLRTGGPLGPHLLKLSKPLTSILPEDIPANQFMMWF